MSKITRCEKNLVKGRALDFFSRDIKDYVEARRDLENAKDEDKDYHRKKVKAIDQRLCENVFNYTIGADCVIGSVNDAFEMIEEYNRNLTEEQENDDK